LEENKKRAYFRYKKWLYSLYNEKNINFAATHELVMLHNDEFQACCTRHGQGQAGQAPG